jgi:hypothetical protein
MDNRLVSPTPTSSKYTERRRLGAYKTGQEPAYKACTLDGSVPPLHLEECCLLECWGGGGFGAPSRSLPAGRAHCCPYLAPTLPDRSDALLSGPHTPNTPVRPGALLPEPHISALKKYYKCSTPVG